jgi:hypothetical protein
MDHALLGEVNQAVLYLLLGRLETHDPVHQRGQFITGQRTRGHRRNERTIHLCVRLRARAGDGSQVPGRGR